MGARSLAGRARSRAAQRRQAARRAAPGGPLHWLQSDWYAALDPALAFDAIVSNPPYIAQHDPHLEQGDLRFEPRGALTDDADGLSAIRTIVAGAGAHLKPGGTLWIEHGYDQAEAVRAARVAWLRRGRIARRSGRDRAYDRRPPARLTPGPRG
jgi:release factor glutamine methyltransferase